MRNRRIAPDIKEQIINRIKNERVTVQQAAQDHGVSEYRELLRARLA